MSMNDFWKYVQNNNRLAVNFQVLTPDALSGIKKSLVHNICFLTDYHIVCTLFIDPLLLFSLRVIHWKTAYDAFFFAHKNSLFAHNRSATVFSSIKLADSEKIISFSCIIDFNDIKVWIRVFSLSLNADLLLMPLSQVFSAVVTEWSPFGARTRNTVSSSQFKSRIHFESRCSTWVHEGAFVMFTGKLKNLELTSERFESESCALPAASIITYNLMLT